MNRSSRFEGGDNCYWGQSHFDQEETIGEITRFTMGGLKRAISRVRDSLSARGQQSSIIDEASVSPAPLARHRGYDEVHDQPDIGGADPVFGREEPRAWEVSAVIGIGGAAYVFDKLVERGARFGQGAQRLGRELLSAIGVQAGPPNNS